MNARLVWFAACALGSGFALGTMTYGCSSSDPGASDGGAKDSAAPTDQSSPPADAGATPTDSGRDTGPTSLTATAAITPTGSDAGAATGTATFVETSGEVAITVQITSGPSGMKGLHVHQVGDCGNLGGNAGLHFDPRGTMAHGHPDSGTHHGGDLGNIAISDAGVGTVSLRTRELTVGPGDASVAGRAIVVHAAPDDGTAASLDAGGNGGTGNSGGRIGCGVITRQ